MKNLNVYNFLSGVLHGLDETCHKLPIDKEIKNFMTLNAMLADELAALGTENENLRKEIASLKADLEEATVEKGYCEDLAKELRKYQPLPYKPWVHEPYCEDTPTEGLEPFPY